jgi:hypothetical protein
MSHSDVSDRRSEPRPQRTTAAARPSIPRRRDRRVSRAAAAAFVGALALCLWGTWKRDQNARALSIAWMDSHRAQLQERLDKAGALPPSIYVQPAKSRTRVPEEYIGSAGRAVIDRLPQPVVVAYSPLIRQYLSYHSRVVILLQDGRLRVEWWPSGKLEAAWARQQRTIEKLTAELETAPPDLP